MGNDELKKKDDELKKTKNGLDYKLERINTMNSADLKNLQTILHDKIKMVENAKESLMDNALNCVVCKDKKKNIVFMDGCDHVAVCDDCENKMQRKCCPLCNAPYT